MNSNIISGIVRIIRPDGKTAGTGFVVSDRLIATSAHVIPEGAQPKAGAKSDKVELVFRLTGAKQYAHVQAEWWRPVDTGDVAILKLDGALPEGVLPLPLGSSMGSMNHAFQTFGFPAPSPEEGIWGDGHILNETLQQGSRVLQISSPQVTPGFSGAPIMDAVNHRVVGMVTAIFAPDAHGRMAETAFVTPTETLRMICPELQLSDVQPYLGLAAFKESDAEFFFGRRREVERLLGSLRCEPRFLAVMGPSGSGKSSVIQAGLVPQLRQGAVPGSDRWGIVTARPGDRPLENLEATGLDLASKGLTEAAADWLAKNPDKNRLMLILDQFEELLATASPQVQKDFLNQLAWLMKSDLPITLMLVMRDDFFSRFAKEAPPELFEWVERGFVHISAALDEGELREIIESPAKKVGLQFEEGLAEAVVKDVLETTTIGERAGRSTILPLLEFALTKLWERRECGFLTHEAYSTIGGVTGSLTQWADQAYQSLAKDGFGDVARHVLTELVSLGDERQNLLDSVRRRYLQDICSQECQIEEVNEVIRLLADARLITTSFDQQRNLETAEIIHDSLIREWGRLRQWLNDDRSFLCWEREIEKKALAWKDGKQDEGRLLRGLDLGEAQKWLEQRSNDVGKEKQRYIQASIALQERERSEKERRRQGIMRGLVAFSTILLILSGIAFWQWDISQQKTEEALALYLASQSEQIEPTSGSDYSRKILLAVESLRHRETSAGDLALRSSMALLARPLAQLDHNSYVNSVAFSPNGNKVLTGSGDHTARIWDIVSGREIYELAHDGSVQLVAFSSDGTKVLTGSSDTVQIWDVATGQELHKLPFNGTVDKAVAFSPDGTKVVTNSYSNTVCWDIASGQELYKLTPNSPVYEAAFSPDGTKIVTGNDDGIVQIWDVARGKELYKLTHYRQVVAVAISPDGTKILMGGSDGTAHIWDIASGQELYKLTHDSLVNSVAFSPDGTKVLTGSSDETARIWDVAGDQKVHKLPHNSRVFSVAFSPDGTKILTASSSSSARIWDVATGKKLHNLTHDNLIFSAAFSPDDRKVVTGSLDGTSRIWDVESGQELHNLTPDSWVFSVAFSPDGTKVLTGCHNGTAHIWDVESGQELHKLTQDGWVYSVNFNPGGTKVVTGSLDGTAYIWDVESGQELHKLTQDGEVCAAAFNHEGTKVLTSSSDNTASIWDVESGQELHRLTHGSLVDPWAFMPDDLKSAVRLDGILAGEFPNVAFSPDDTKVITNSYDRTARIWDVATGQVLHKLPHNGEVYAASFSPDGTKILTGSSDNMARIWDVATGQELHKLPHNGEVHAAAFSPNGTEVVTGSDDETAWIWPVSDKDLIEHACDCIPENLTIEEWLKYPIYDIRTCPKEGRFNQSSNPLVRLFYNPKGFLTGSEECQPCIAEDFLKRK